MKAYTPYLEVLDCQREAMCELVTRWCRMNTHSLNVEGLNRMAVDVRETFSSLHADVEECDVGTYRVIDDEGNQHEHDLGPLLLFRKRPDAEHRVLLGIHMDTVYPVDHPFQEVVRSDEELRGPGVADAKGGLVVMFKALEALEASPHAEKIGWDVFVNPDEEIGSPGSGKMLKEVGLTCRLGLLFEPALPDGSIVSERSGTGNYTLVVHGRAAHAGRDPEHGRNAINALARMILELEVFQSTRDDIIVNVGRIDGGGPVNVVPDLAVCHIGVRLRTRESQQAIRSHLDALIKEANQAEGIDVELHVLRQKIPKLVDDRVQSILDGLAWCGSELGLPITWQHSAGASDGNVLAEVGLPAIDSLGPRGGNLHSEDEYLVIDSLVERARLTALFLMRFASGEIEV